MAIRVSASRREGPNPRLSIKARGLDTRVSASRRVGRNPRLSRHYSTKARGLTPASQQYCGTKAQGAKSASQHQGAWAETRASVITALVMGPVTAHIAGKLTPHCGAFLGGTFTPENSINSPAATRKRYRQEDAER